jgi:hypothetical protein
VADVLDGFRSIQDVRFYSLDAVLLGAVLLPAKVHRASLADLPRGKGCLDYLR